MSRSSYCGGMAETPLNEGREEMSMCRDATIRGLKSNEYMGFKCLNLCELKVCN